MTATFKMGIKYRLVNKDGDMKLTTRFQGTEIQGTSVRQIFRKAKTRLQYELSQPGAVECTTASIKFKEIGGFLLDSDF